MLLKAEKAGVVCNRKPTVKELGMISGLYNYFGKDRTKVFSYIEAAITNWASIRRSVKWDNGKFLPIRAANISGTVLIQSGYRTGNPPNNKN